MNAAPVGKYLFQCELREELVVEIVIDQKYSETVSSHGIWCKDAGVHGTAIGAMATPIAGIGAPGTLERVAAREMAAGGMRALVSSANATMDETDRLRPCSDLAAQ